MHVSSPIPHKRARIEIIPLIDVMFFLLASFMMVSLSQVHMKGMKVNLPTGSSGETQSKRDYISVSVDKDGHYFFDKDEVTDTDLQARLVKVHQSDPEAKVFVRGDRVIFFVWPQRQNRYSTARRRHGSGGQPSVAQWQFTSQQLPWLKDMRRR